MTDQALTFRVTAEASQAQAELAKTGVALKAMGTNASAAMAEAALGEKAMLGEMAAGIEETAAAFASFLSGGIIAAGLAELGHIIDETTHGIAEMGRQADRVGVSAENFQAWTFGMREAGVAEGELSTGLDRFTRNIGEASLGTTKFGTMLQENGIQLRGASGEIRDTTSLLKDFADLIEATPDKAQRMALVTEAFGRGSAAMSEALSHGGKGLDEMIIKAHELGVVMDNEMVAKAKELDIAFDTVKTQVGTFLKEALLGDLEIIKDMVAAGRGLANMGVTTPLTPAQSDQAKVIDQANAAAGAINGEVDALNLMGKAVDANLLKDTGTFIENQAAALKDGKITISQFRDEMDLAIKGALGLFDELQSLDGIDYSLTIGKLKDVGAELDTVAGKAAAAAAAAAIVPSLQHPISTPTPNTMGFPDYSGPDHTIRSPYGSIPSGFGLGNAPTKTTVPTSGGGAGGAASDSIAGLSAQAQKAMDTLNLAIATVNEKVHDGLLSTADGVKAISDAKTKANNDLAAIIAQVTQLGPAGQAAATELRTHLQGATDAMAASIADLSKSLADGLISPLKDFEKGTITAGDAFTQMGDVIINKLIEIAAQQAETKFLEPMISGLASMLGGSDFGNAVLSAFGIAPHDAGGTIPAGGIGLVGERGPELIRAGATPLQVTSRVDTSRIFESRLREISSIGQMPALHAASAAAAAQRMPAPQVNVKVEGVPPSHAATVHQSGDGMSQMITIVLDAVDQGMAANLRAGRGAHVAALADTFNLKRSPR